MEARPIRTKTGTVPHWQADLLSKYIPETRYGSTHKRRAPHEAVVAAIETLDLELLPCLDLVEPTDLGGQDDLPLGRHPGSHQK